MVFVEINRSLRFLHHYAVMLRRKKSSKEIEFEKGNLNYCLKNSIYLAQCFSAMPLYEVNGKWVFRWISFKTTYNLFVMALHVIYIYFLCVFAVEDGEKFFKYGKCMDTFFSENSNFQINS